MSFSGLDQGLRFLIYLWPLCQIPRIIKMLHLGEFNWNLNYCSSHLRYWYATRLSISYVIFLCSGSTCFGKPFLVGSFYFLLPFMQAFMGFSHWVFCWCFNLPFGIWPFLILSFTLEWIVWSRGLVIWDVLMIITRPAFGGLLDWIKWFTTSPIILSYTKS